MLTPTPDLPVLDGRNRRRERRLWHDGQRHTPSLGCTACPERPICGGLSVQASRFDCLDVCCGTPAHCDNVCRNNPDYADRVREVGTFRLDTTPPTEAITTPILPKVVPLLFHGSSRKQTIAPIALALSLYSLFNRRDATMRYTTREELCANYRISPETLIVLSGTDRDAPLERWWSFGERQRRQIIPTLRRLGIALVTTPNYSLFLDVPRWNDLHAMKRIAITHHEFVSEGVPAALHINGRTETDFQRWTDYLVSRPAITHVAYEFTTGSTWVGRRELHTAWLTALAKSVGRPLHLVVRGGVEILPALAQSFDALTFLDTSSFIKTMMRQRASLNGTRRIHWLPAPTSTGTPVDDLLTHNMSTVQSWLEPLFTSTTLAGS